MLASLAELTALELNSAVAASIIYLSEIRWEMQKIVVRPGKCRSVTGLEISGLDLKSAKAP